MVSDGVIDAGEEQYGGIQWILDYICRNDTLNPKELADGILNEAREISNGQVKDDMTVLVSKIYVA